MTMTMITEKGREFVAGLADWFETFAENRQDVLEALQAEDAESSRAWFTAAAAALRQIADVGREVVPGDQEEMERWWAAVKDR